MDRPLMPVCPKHMTYSPPPTYSWPPSPSPPPTWLPHHQRAPCFPQMLPQAKYPPPHGQVAGIPPPHAMYKIDPVMGVTTHIGQSCLQLPLDLHPSKESIDAVIGDILSKPCQPLPLGVKPPALDSVMVQLNRQGIPKIPPACIWRHPWNPTLGITLWKMSAMANTTPIVTTVTKPTTKESYDHTCSSYGTGTEHGYRSRNKNRSRYVKRGRKSKSLLSHISEISTSDGGHGKSKSKRHRSMDEDDLAIP
ncbi:hypothetical protein Tco_0336282 [Tanacetum coccineum]